MTTVSVGFKDGKNVPPVTVNSVLITDKNDIAKIIAEKNKTDAAIAALPPANTPEERFKQKSSIYAASNVTSLGDAAYSKVRAANTTVEIDANGNRREIFRDPNARPTATTPTSSQPAAVPAASKPLGLKEQARQKNDAGTNDPKRTTNDTQRGIPSTGPYIRREQFVTLVPGGAAYGNPNATIRGQDRGATQLPAPAWPNDDNPNLPPRQSQREVIINSDGQPSNFVKPRANILDQFASYTYNIAWYMLSPAQYAALNGSANRKVGFFRGLANFVRGITEKDPATATSRIGVGNWSLLMQSGGASQQKHAVVKTGVAFADSNVISQPDIDTSIPNRNKYFTLDYYLDDLVIKTVVTNASASQVSELSFKVSEPNGLTLIPNINYAIRDGIPGAAPVNTDFCLVISFYGWDIDGNLITDPSRDTGLPGAVPNIENAILTRYYPFKITNIDFTVESKSVVYQVTGAPQQYTNAASTALGSVPMNIDLTGETVSQILSGKNSILATLAEQQGNLADGRETSATSSPLGTKDSATNTGDGSFDPSTQVI
jgi:hypothetical protein